MLDLAVKHVPELQQRYLGTIGDQRYRYYQARPGQLYYIPLADDNMVGLQYVSIDPALGGVVGYIGCALDRLTRTAGELEAIRFRESPEYSADLYRFLDMIFNRFGMDKVVWDVAVGNPAEGYFDRLAAAYGINIVGTFHNAVMLPDGRLYDRKYYEFLARDFRAAGDRLGDEAPYLYKEVGNK